MKGLGAGNGQIAALLSYESRRGVLTANATTPYHLGFADPQRHRAGAPVRGTAGTGANAIDPLQRNSGPSAGYQALPMAA
jgi:hypothetical protein